jgi:hypothetical protein
MAQCMESESKTWQFAPARWSWRRPFGHCAIYQYSLVLEFWAKESEASGIFPNSRSPKTGVLFWVLLRAGHLLKMTLFKYHWPVTHAWFPSLVSKSFVWTMCAFGRCCWWSLECWSCEFLWSYCWDCAGEYGSDICNVLSKYWMCYVLLRLANFSYMALKDMILFNMDAGAEGAVLIL